MNILKSWLEVHLFRNSSSTMALIATWTVIGLIMPVHADTLVLESGGLVDGKWINVNRKADDEYQIQLAAGGLISIPASSVREVIQQNDEELEYQRIAPTFDDTVIGQWEAAEWCRNHNLKKCRDHHLRRVIELQPDHTKAWIALGYIQVNGTWKRRKEIAEENGYSFHQGRWRLTQEIRLVEQRQHISAVQVDWRQRINKWVAQMHATDRTGSEARRQLSEIRDPLAIPFLVHHLRSDPRPPYRLFFVEILNQIPSPEAFQALLDASLLEGHPEVMHAVIDRVVKRKSPAVVEYYCQALGKADNATINRAAYVLGRLDDSSSVGPLIKALHTRHLVYFVPRRSSPDGAMTVAFSSNDRQAAVFGPQLLMAPEPVENVVIVANQEVHAALLKITGTDYGYNVESWKQWHASWLASQPTPLTGRRTP